MDLVTALQSIVIAACGLATFHNPHWYNREKRYALALLTVHLCLLTQILYAVYCLFPVDEAVFAVLLVSHYLAFLSLLTATSLGLQMHVVSKTSLVCLLLCNVVSAGWYIWQEWNQATSPAIGAVVVTSQVMMLILAVVERWRSTHDICWLNIWGMSLIFFKIAILVIKQGDSADDAVAIIAQGAFTSTKSRFCHGGLRALVAGYHY